MIQSKNKANKSDTSPHFLLSLVYLDPQHLKPPGGTVTRSLSGHVGTHHMHENTDSAKADAQTH